MIPHSAMLDGSAPGDGSTQALHAAVPGAKIWSPWYNKRTEYNQDTEAPVSADRYTGEYADIRKLLDHKYHGIYTPERQAVQDELVKKMLTAGGDSSEHPWIIFSAGPMGAGKGHTITYLNKNGFNSIPKLVYIDPDKLRVQLPEWNKFVEENPLTAGARTQHEVGYMQEIATEAALKESKNVFVDGSLANAEWFSQVFADIRSRFPQYHIAIIYVSCKRSVVHAHFFNHMH